MKPRTGIPTPGRPSATGSGIPTPGSRSRSSSQVGLLSSSSSNTLDEEYMNLAFKDAVKANDPAMHRSVSASRAKTPTAMRPPSRQSDVGIGIRSASRAGWVPEPGDGVRIESLGFEGILRYVGEIDGKQGLWAGVELSGGFAGKGKNDGSVNGKQYFTCPPKCGVFVATTKLSPPTVGRPPSVASSRGGRTTPSFSTSTSGRITPSSFSMSRSGRMSYGSGRTTPSTSGRITPSTSTGGISPETPAIRAARLRSMAKGTTSTTSTASITPVARSKSAAGQAPTPGTRASKYVGMTAKQLSLNKSLSSPSSSTSLSPIMTTSNIPGPGASPSRIRTISSGPGSPFSTPKPAGAAGTRFGGIGLGSPATMITKAGETPKAQPRIPSAVAMPPPPLPIPSSRGSGSPMQRSVSASSSSTTSAPDSPTRRGTIDGLMSREEINARGKVLQERIAGLTGAAPSQPLPSSPPPQAPASPVRRTTITSRARSRSRAGTTTAPGSPRRPPSRVSVSRPSSVASGRVSVTGGRVSVDPEVMQSRIDALEYENERLRGRVGQLEGEVIEANSRATAAAAAEATATENDAQRAVVDKLQLEKRRLEERRSELEYAYDESRKEVERLKEEKKLMESEKTHLQEVNNKLEEEKVRTESEKAVFEESQAGLESEKQALEKAKTDLEEKLRKLVVEFEEERRDLNDCVDELRQAGQASLYEEKLRQADLQRYELEDKVVELEAQGSSKSAIGKGSMNGAANAAKGAEILSTPVQTTSQIETETLHLQLSHLREKVSSLEELLDDTKQNYEQERSAFTVRLERTKEREEAVRSQLADLTMELAEVKKEKERVKADGERRVQEIEEALRESGVALEEMRAEVEGLRGDLVNANGLAASTSSTTGELQSKLTKTQMEKEELVDETERLKHLIEDQTSELETLRKKVNRDVSINGGVQSPSTPSKYDKHELNSAKEEIMGLKHIIQELQKETVIENQKNKVLEAENQLLISEMEQLRQEVKILEDNLDQSILREEENLHLDVEGAGDLDSLKKILKEQRLKADKEVEHLRKKIADMEMKNARTTHDACFLEISELEALVEAKIYREDELEEEVKRLKDKIARQEKKSAKFSTGLAPENSSSSSTSHGPTGDVCEICERPGHDIFNCDLLKEDGPLSAKSTTNAAHKAINGDNPTSSDKETEPEDLWCEDCEGYGHLKEECPNSEDVF
uniref:CAP-Gly domain-containing protein n=1 Tax=Moniliophthora roreri TaxID=221103 RepID=A0A0W0FSC5_MONRR